MGHRGGGGETGGGWAQGGKGGKQKAKKFE